MFQLVILILKFGSYMAENLGQSTPKNTPSNVLIFRPRISGPK